MSEGEADPKAKDGMKFQIAARPDGIVVLEFAEPLKWIGMDAVNARIVARGLLRASFQAEQMLERKKRATRKLD